MLTLGTEAAGHLPNRMYLMDHPPTSADRITIALDFLAYVGLRAFVVAFSSGLDDRVVGSLVLTNVIVLIPVALLALRIMVDKRIRKFCDLHFFLMTFAIWAAASYMWTVAPDRTSIRAGTYMALVVLLILIWELASNATRVRGLIISYVLGAGAASLMTIYNYLMGESSSKLEGKEWDTLRYTANGINPDELGMIVALSIPMALYLIIASKNRALRGACWSQVIAGVTAILLSGTRGAMIALAVGLIAMIRPTFSRMSATQRGAALLACLAIVYGGLFFVPKTARDRFLSIGTELTQGTMTHRTQLWSAGIEVFREHPWVGIGSGAYGPAIERIVDRDLIAHNTFISVLVELGVVGALLFTAVLAGLVYSAFRLPSLEKQTWLALLATWAVGVSSISWENRKTTWFLFGLLAAHRYVKKLFLVRFMCRPQETDSPSGPAVLPRATERPACTP